MLGGDNIEAARDLKDAGAEGRLGVTDDGGLRLVLGSRGRP